MTVTRVAFSCNINSNRSSESPKTRRLSPKTVTHLGRPYHEGRHAGLIPSSGTSPPDGRRVILITLVFVQVSAAEEALTTQLTPVQLLTVSGAVVTAQRRLARAARLTYPAREPDDR